MGNEIRVWLVERTYSDDEQNLVVLVYATPDGSQAFRKERALTSFTGEARETTAGLCVSPDNLAEVTDEERRKRFAVEASRMSDEHRPDGEI